MGNNAGIGLNVWVYCEAVLSVVLKLISCVCNGDFDISQVKFFAKSELSRLIIVLVCQTMRRNNYIYIRPR